MDGACWFPVVEGVETLDAVVIGFILLPTAVVAAGAGDEEVDEEDEEEDEDEEREDVERSSDNFPIEVKIYPALTHSLTSSSSIWIIVSLTEVVPSAFEIEYQLKCIITTENPTASIWDWIIWKLWDTGITYSS